MPPHERVRGFQYGGEVLPVDQAAEEALKWPEEEARSWPGRLCLFVCFVFVCLCLFVCLFVCLGGCLFVCLFVFCFFVFLFVCFYFVWVGVGVSGMGCGLIGRFGV